jgi:hypothetical protein
MAVHAVRTSLAGVALGALIAVPAAALVAASAGAGGLVPVMVTGLAAAIDRVGWVLAPQILLAVAVVGVALQRLTSRIAGFPPPPSVAWLDPAVESALLLGMLGTLSGMVSGFVGLSPEELEPGPLVHSLGTALRSSFVGFLIALIGVWAKAQPGADLAAAREAAAT